MVENILGVLREIFLLNIGILFYSVELSLWDLPPRRLEVYLLDRVFATFTFSLCK